MTDNKLMEVTKERDALLKILKSIVADVEAMHFPVEDDFMEIEMDGNSFFGDFTDFYDNEDMTLRSGGEGIRIYWPNLWILLQDAKELIEGIAPHKPNLSDVHVKNLSDKKGGK